MIISYKCGEQIEVYANDIQPRQDAVITVSVNSKCTSDSPSGPEIIARRKNETQSHRKVLAKPGGVDSFTVEEGGKVLVRCDGTGADGCNVEVTVNSVTRS